MEEAPNIVVFGGPETGKTSFIARLSVENKKVSMGPVPRTEIEIAGKTCHVWDSPRDTLSEYSLSHVIASAGDLNSFLCQMRSDRQLVMSTAIAKQAANLLVFVWDASKPAPVKEFHNRLVWMQSQGIPIHEIPLIFVACKSDQASGILTPQKIDEEVVRKIGLTKVKYVGTSAEKNSGFSKFKKAVDELLSLSPPQDELLPLEQHAQGDLDGSPHAQSIHALALDYQATKFAHTRESRFLELNNSDIAKKDPKDLTPDEVEWLWLNWKSINDRKSQVSLWIEKRLACKFGIYTYPTQPYTEQQRQQFDEHLPAKEANQQETHGEELQLRRKSNFAESQQKFQQAHLLLVLLATYETSKFVKLGCFFFKCYREWVRHYKIGLMASAALMFETVKNNKSVEAVEMDMSKLWAGNIPTEVGRIVGLAR